MVKEERVVRIDWVDSCSNYGWRPKEDGGVSMIHSVGLLVEEKSDCVMITTSRSEYGNCIDQLSIPKACIKKMKKFRLPG